MARYENNSIILEENERLVFPVRPDNPLAKAQQLVDIDSLDQVKDFEFVKELRRISTDRQPFLFRAGQVSEADLLNQIRQRVVVDIRQRGRLLKLTVDNFTIPPGATFEMQGPFNLIEANTVIIQGRLEFHGDLAITCNEIRGI